MNTLRIVKSSAISALLLVLMTGLVAAQSPEATALGSGFTYQGQLLSNGEPFSGSCDFHFNLYDAVGMGTALTELSMTDVPVSEGTFTVQLDFGTAFFNGDSRWLEIWVRCPSGSGEYQVLHPRQPLTAAPYALYAKSAPWTGIAGVPAGFADGADNDTTYTAGMGLIQSNTTFSVDTSLIQARVTEVCASGYAIKQINTNGDVVCEPFWSLNGNAGTSPTINFIGTPDNQALEIRVNDERALRIEPTSPSPNLIGGYFDNLVRSGVYAATISGGGSEDYPNKVFDNYGTIGGGSNNTAGSDGTDHFNSLYATVSGGNSNDASGYNASIGGGSHNTASGAGAAVGGGTDNTASGYYAMIPGGNGNTAAGSYSFAAGLSAKANQPGCFVWADSSDTAFLSCNDPDRWIARAAGGVYFYTDSGASTGVYLDAGGGSWINVSNRALKENFSSIDNAALLERLAQFPITTWNLKTQDDSIIHVGLMADEFNSLLTGLGGEGQDNINTMDAIGVSMAAIQGLYDQNQDLKAEIASQQEQLDALESRLTALETQNSAHAAASPALWLLGLLAPLAGLWLVRQPKRGDR